MIRSLMVVAAVALTAGCGDRTPRTADEGGAVRAAGEAMQSAGAAAAADQSPPEGLSWIAVRDINRVYDDDMSPTDRPPLVTEPPEGMITQIRISPDGRTDWRMDYSEAGANQWCGTGGCRQRLFASTPDGLIQVLDAPAIDLEATQDDRIRLGVPASYCGPQTNQDECHVVLVYDAAARRLVVVEGPDDFNPMGWSHSP